MKRASTSPSPRALSTAIEAPHAVFPDADAAEARLRRQALTTSVVLWVPVAVLVVAAGFWLGPLAALGVLAAQALMFAGTVLSSFRAARRMMRTAPLHPITERTQPELHALCADVADRFGMPLPPCYVIEDDSVNAFAILLGPRKPVFVLHTGYLKVATPAQVRGVIAHEMAHLANRDGLVHAMTRGSGALLKGTSSALAGTSSLLSGSSYRTTNTDLLMLLPRLLFGTVLPMVFHLLLMGVRRSRESLADLTGARALGGAEPLLDTMRLLTEYERAATGATSTADSRWRSHPPTKRRIEALLDTCGVQVSALPAD